MAAINRTDLIQVTGRRGKSTVLTMTISGADSIDDVFRQVRSSTPEGKGIIALSLRNRTQGWVQQHTLVFRESRKVASQQTVLPEWPSLFDNV